MVEVPCDEEEAFPRKHLSTETDGSQPEDKHQRAHSREVTAAPGPHAMTSRRCFPAGGPCGQPTLVQSHQGPEPAPGWAWPRGAAIWGAESGPGTSPGGASCPGPAQGVCLGHPRKYEKQLNSTVLPEANPSNRPGNPRCSSMSLLASPTRFPPSLSPTETPASPSPAPLHLLCSTGH